MKRPHPKPAADLKKTAMKTSEAAFSKAFVKLFTLYGYVGYHTRDSRGSRRGFQDWVLVNVKPGKDILFVELKSDTGQERPEQRKWRELVNGARNGRAYVFRPDDLQAITNLFAGE